jgi:hypothetical protein
MYARLAAIGTGGGGGEAPQYFRNALQDAVKACGISAKDLDAVVLATNQTSGLAEGERTALGTLDIRKDRWIEFAGVTGDVGAAYGGLSVILACSLLRERHGWRYIAVNGVDDGRCMTMVLKNGGVV